MYSRERPGAADTNHYEKAARDRRPDESGLEYLETSRFQLSSSWGKMVFNILQGVYMVTNDKADLVFPKNHRRAKIGDHRGTY